MLPAAGLLALDPSVQVALIGAPAAITVAVGTVLAVRSRRTTRESPPERCITPDDLHTALDQLRRELKDDMTLPFKLLLHILEKKIGS
jgi:hypothetical protein